MAVMVRNGAKIISGAGKHSDKRYRRTSRRKAKEAAIRESMGK